MDLSRRYRVSAVPKTMINGASEIVGALPEQAFVEAVVAAVPAAREPANQRTDEPGS